MTDDRVAGAAEVSDTDGRQGIQSVEIAMTVLAALEQGRGPMSLTQIAQAGGMGVSKAYRYLVSLGRAGLVAQSRSTGLYDMGPALRRLGAESLRRMDEVGLVSEFIPGLRDRTGHAVNLAVWGDHGPVIVRWDYGSSALPITVRVGATMPLLTSAVGRVYLAQLPRTLTDPVLHAQLQGELPPDVDRVAAEVRAAGYALTAGGLIPGVASVAAPVLTTGESLPLVVAVAMPERAATPEALEAVTADLLTTTAAMSAELGVAL